MSESEAKYSVELFKEGGEGAGQEERSNGKDSGTPIQFTTRLPRPFRSPYASNTENGSAPFSTTM